MYVKVINGFPNLSHCKKSSKRSIYTTKTTFPIIPMNVFQCQMTWLALCMISSSFCEAKALLWLHKMNCWSCTMHWHVLQQCSCNSGYYGATAAACAPCPVGGVCPGGNVVTSQPGYVASSSSQYIFLQCLSVAACPGNNTCGIGYEISRGTHWSLQIYREIMWRLSIDDSQVL